MNTKFTILKTILFFGLWLTSYTSVCQQIVYEDLLDKKDNLYYFLSSKYSGDVAVKYNNGQIKQRYKVKDGVGQDTLINYFEDSKFDRSKFLDTSYCFMLSGKIKQKKELIITLINDTLKSRQEINNFIENEIGGIKKLEKLNERSSDGKLNKKNQMLIDSLTYFNSQQTSLLNSLFDLQAEVKQFQEHIKEESTKPVYQPKIESIFKHENFIKNGKFLKYSDVGNKIQEGQYLNGKQEGDWLYYFPNGKLFGKGKFKDGDGGNPNESSGIPKNGRFGNWIFYYENGNLKEEVNYLNGLLNGIRKSYYENGKLNEEINYASGLMNGNRKIYYENSKLKQESNLINDLDNGVYKLYFENGILKEEGNFKNGLLDGVQKNYFDSGKLKQYVIYKEDKVNGLFKKYYENGSLEAEIEYVLNEQNGIYKSYYSNGQLRSSAKKNPKSLAEKNLVGDAFVYNEDGKLVQHIKYELDGSYVDMLTKNTQSKDSESHKCEWCGKTYSGTNWRLMSSVFGSCGDRAKMDGVFWSYCSKKCAVDDCNSQK